MQPNIACSSADIVTKCNSALRCLAPSLAGTCLSRLHVSGYGRPDVTECGIML